MLDVENLEFDYSHKPLLQSIQFRVNPGCLLHLRGANGAGKTTLLKLLAGLLHPAAGDIQFDGQSIYKDIVSYQQRICYVGHKVGISQLLTVRENCRFELHQNTHAKSLDDLLTLFALDGLGDIPCGLLSVGQRRRVGMLRLAMSNALLWLLDEPLVALDDEAIGIFMSSLSRHLASGGLVVLTSHQDLPLEPGLYQEYRL